MKKAKILIIDDDLDTQDLISSFFRVRDYELLVYGDAAKALDDINQNKVDPDVIITDLMMPGLSGIEFTQRMKMAGNSLPIILITANKKVEIAVEAIAAGAYDFVVKPLHFPQLLVSVERALFLNKIKEENTTLKSVVQLQAGQTSIEGVVGKSQGLRNALDLARRVAKSTANILITGESGTGKEVIAKAIHAMGPRKKEPFIAINCSAIPENLLESELFGHAKGSFTGAAEKRRGLFEEAEGGTLFLDEIGDMSLPLQAKLLRVLQEKKIKRVGENQYKPIDVRILSATHKNLKQEILNKNFREDLFFRLNVIPIGIPPLRERKEDILPLSEFFIRKFSVTNGTAIKQLSKEALEYLMNNKWPGNVRELENTIERAVVLSNQNVIQYDDVVTLAQTTEVETDKAQFQFPTVGESKILTVDELVNKYVQHILKLNHGVKEKTAKDLKIDRKTLYRRLREIDNNAHPDTSMMM
ncbi:MAG: sigma-54-dependent Fis family transcriptional regulator [Moraxellaceae bacterium]|nr:sigma-54-dependent Fis family transcriptional regulator [Pseudobdellovibrionaceae bacterium]